MKIYCNVSLGAYISNNFEDSVHYGSLQFKSSPQSENTVEYSSFPGGRLEAAKRCFGDAFLLVITVGYLRLCQH